MSSGPILTDVERAFMGAARRAVLATADPRGRPRLVPICFVLGRDGADGLPRLYTPLDEKPKRDADPRRLARVRDIVERASVTVLVDRWDEDWTRLAWLRCHGTAEVLEASASDTPDAPDAPDAEREAERDAAIADLRGKHHQYAGHGLETRPLIRISIARVSSWGALEAATSERAARST